MSPTRSSALLGKPENAVYEKFAQEYKKMNEKLGLKQYLVPYLMSSHPGSTLKEAVELAEHLRDLGYMPEQGTGTSTDTFDDIDLYVLHGTRSADDGAGLCADEPA